MKTILGIAICGFGLVEALTILAQEEKLGKVEEINFSNNVKSGKFCSDFVFV